MLGHGNFIDFGDSIINMDFIKHIEKLHKTDYDGNIIDFWRVRTTEYADYVDLNQKQYEFLLEALKSKANCYIVY